MTKKPIKKSTLALLCLICVAVAQFIFQTSQLSKGTEYIVSSLTNDDTYYYLQTAWNAKHLGYVTFDGLHTTNGVQFAWFGIIFLLSVISSTKMALLYITLATCFLLNAICYFVIWKIFQILKQPVLSVFAASFWLAVSLTSTYSLGLENSLHAFIYWILIWQVLIFLRQVQKKKTPNIIALTLILVLNAWVRLDSAVFSAVLYLSCIIILGLNYPNIRLFLRENAKLLAISILLAGSGLVIQLGAFWLMGGSLLPVSAIVKSSGANWGWGADSLRYLTDLLLLSIPESLYIPLFIAAFSWLVFLGLAIGLKRIKPGIDQTRYKNFRQLWFFQFIGMLVYHLVIVLYGIFDSPYFTWYRSPSYIFWIITLVNLVFFIQDIHPKLKIEVFERIVIVISLTTIFLSGYLFVKNVISNNNLASKDFHTHRYQIALWISENSPPDTIYAAWNAGELGFFSNQKVINLDGLINNAEYYESVLLSPTPVEALAVYLDENHVSYIVDYQENEHTSRLPIVKSFPSPDESDRLIRIWQVIPWSK
jgi:hypothetical protein